MPQPPNTPKRQTPSYTSTILLQALLLWALTPAPAPANPDPQPTRPNHATTNLPTWEPVTVPITRDTWVSSATGERDANLGGAERLKLKGIQEFSILDFDPLSLRGRVIRAAQLHLRRRSTPLPHRVTVSTITSPWVEGTSPRYTTQIGSASFLWAAQGKQHWAYPGSDITAVVAGAGNSIWGFADASEPDTEGSITIPVLPTVIAARVAGISHGLAVIDDVGSEYEHDGPRFKHLPFPNRYVYSRESRRKYAPHLTVFLGERDVAPPASVGRITASNTEPWLHPGEAYVSWVSPQDVGPAGTIGFTVQVGAQTLTDGGDGSVTLPNYLVPPAAEPGQPIHMHLRDLGLTPGTTVSVRVRPIDAAGNTGPTSIGLVELKPQWPDLIPDRQPDPTPQAQPRPNNTNDQTNHQDNAQPPAAAPPQQPNTNPRLRPRPTPVRHRPAGQTQTRHRTTHPPSTPSLPPPKPPMVRRHWASHPQRRA